MNRTRFKRTALISLVLLIGLVGVFGLWLHAQQRQYALNRQLIAALVKDDTKAAIALVNEGADPNTRYKPTALPSLPDLVKRMFHRLPPPVNDSPTAFLMACGAFVYTDVSASLETIRVYGSDDAQLTQAMLKHGANANARSSIVSDGGWTALMSAARNCRWNTVGVLLEHGADANAKDEYGQTPLMFAAEGNANPDVVRLLLEHGANVNANDNSGMTPLMYATEQADPDVVRLLLQHRANVNAKDRDGRTCLMLAKGHPDKITILRYAGAKK